PLLRDPPARTRRRSPRHPDDARARRSFDDTDLYPRPGGASPHGLRPVSSESVTEGHPDKIADQISDSILDAILAQDPVGRVACETLVTTGLAIVAGEITTSCYVDFPSIVRETIREVGYTRGKYGFDSETCAVLSSIHGQSPDIAQGV